MTIWLLVLVMLASLAGLGYRQGAIRVGISFLGILLGVALAVPLGRLLGRVLGPLGVKDPVLAWALGPLIVFILISMLVKTGAAFVHHKVDVYYKYKVGDLRLALWERLNARLGLCLGILNGTAYLLLLAFALYLPGYVAVQVTTSPEDPKWLRLLGQVGRDMRSTGFDKVARAVDSMPQIDYDMADLAALLYHNPLLEARLERYPGLLALAERPEFQGLGSDKGFIETWQRLDPVMAIFSHPRIRAIRDNPELLKTIWDAVAADLPDLRAYLTTGNSARYDPQKILGRWQFDVGYTLHALRRAKPTMPATEMAKWKRWLLGAFTKTSLVARPDNGASLKSLPQLKLPAAGAAPSGPQNLEGKWLDLDGGKYTLAVGGQDLPAVLENERLTLKMEGLELVFVRED